MAQKMGLNSNQLKAIEALLTTPSMSAAARQCGLARRTLFRYLSDETFKAELRKRQDEAVTAVTAALSGLTGEAIEALHDLLANPETSASVKARVALGWLSERRKALELDELTRRVMVLEERTKGNGTNA